MDILEKIYLKSLFPKSVNKANLTELLTPWQEILDLCNDFLQKEFNMIIMIYKLKSLLFIKGLEGIYEVMDILDKLYLSHKDLYIQYIQDIDNLPFFLLYNPDLYLVTYNKNPSKKMLDIIQPLLIINNKNKFYINLKIALNSLIGESSFIHLNNIITEIKNKINKLTNEEKKYVLNNML